MSQETIGRVIENAAHGILSVPHDALNPINGAQIMTPVYAVTTSGANKNILVVIRHAYNFVGHNLADGKDEVETAIYNEAVYLSRPRIVQLALRLFVDELRRYFAKGLDISSPVVDAEKVSRHRSKHSRDLVWLHGGMGAEGRQNCLELVAIVLPRVARQVAG